jgi:type I restriction enzyme R subunit
MKTGEEGLVTDFLSPEQLWEKTFPVASTSLSHRGEAVIECSRNAAIWRDKFASIPFEDKGGT